MIGSCWACSGFISGPLPGHCSRIQLTVQKATDKSSRPPNLQDILQLAVHFELGGRQLHVTQRLDRPITKVEFRGGGGGGGRGTADATRDSLRPEGIHHVLCGGPTFDNLCAAACFLVSRTGVSLP
jgi:hypothetical protein